jgi:hypothetical protein
MTRSPRIRSLCIPGPGGPRHDGAGDNSEGPGSADSEWWAGRRGEAIEWAEQGRTMGTRPGGAHRDEGGRAEGRGHRPRQCANPPGGAARGGPRPRVRRLRAGAHAATLCTGPGQRGRPRQAGQARAGSAGEGEAPDPRPRGQAGHDPPRLGGRRLVPVGGLCRVEHPMDAAPFPDLLTSASLHFV